MDRIYINIPQLIDLLNVMSKLQPLHILTCVPVVDITAFQNGQYKFERDHVKSLI